MWFSKAHCQVSECKYISEYILVNVIAIIEWSNDPLDQPRHCHPCSTSGDNIAATLSEDRTFINTVI